MAGKRSAPTGEKPRTKVSPGVRRLRSTTRVQRVHVTLRTDLIEVTQEVLAARRKQALAAGKSADDYTLPERLRRFTEDGSHAFLRSDILAFLPVRRPVEWVAATTRIEPDAIRALALHEGIPLQDPTP